MSKKERVLDVPYVDPEEHPSNISISKPFTVKVETNRHYVTGCVLSMVLENQPYITVAAADYIFVQPGGPLPITVASKGLTFDPKKVGVGARVRVYAILFYQPGDNPPTENPTTENPTSENPPSENRADAYLWGKTYNLIY